MYASLDKYNDNDIISNIFTSHTHNNIVFMRIEAYIWLCGEP